jgi:hypothetical protein
MKGITYEHRISQIKSVGDVAIQLQRAKGYKMRLRAKVKSATSLGEKVELGTALKRAESVLRKLRMNVFELEDSVGCNHA